ncbi:MAG: flavodoxin-dependent (E)-4-hydroxy-3-methylbut-2-enyl-diphosphate synthase [Eubacteriaceae bacterium]|nr:flavodoxin-dependent (E)-4-hydroxy-3-methylbut-2-enyl-diphosphate synthase [Eubacteriaceae bacterium]MBQ1466129.1 flavodoxin-dependent (E)-4-hydroxy-3-methylbut-2-enyl-diphosphate synthase [Eubacteriaceae bacterium]MBR2780559.1 flavodoxin-dependent (E)-4-hydroxy-3-methylbut-2-enyl-diphosphate synthase [Eubacteriaceae bacterium]MCR4895006.1 flavodoxin-dependent (E)-4-hydroxy-3-methylbut-2-enyl-diphosphate synthase [Eubacteriales bacterium]
MRKQTRAVKVSDVIIGGGFPVSIQSMLNIPLTDTDRVLSSIHELEEAGCQIIRAAVPDMESAGAIRTILPHMRVPLVADIHFDYRLAIASVEAGVSKVRINPGNIGGPDKVREVCACLREHDIPVRVGVNSGSVEKDLLEKYGHVCADALVESAERSIGYFNEFGYDNIVMSIKSSDVVMTVEANRLFSSRHDYPLHLGVTEAGAALSGVIRSSVGIGTLLMEGIGDTIRVSLTGDPVQEVVAAKEILTAADMRREGVRIVSCPTCARCKTDTLSIVEYLKEHTSHIKENVVVAVMGCVVNGPGESREADVGVACGDGKGAVFRDGEIYMSVPTGDLKKVLLEEIEKIAERKRSEEKDQ